MPANEYNTVLFSVETSKDERLNVESLYLFHRKPLCLYIHRSLLPNANLEEVEYIF